jgi:hypothetical protein
MFHLRCRSIYGELAQVYISESDMSPMIEVARLHLARLECVSKLMIVDGRSMAHDFTR